MKNKKIIKLSESDLYRIVNNMIKENEMEYWSTQDDEGNNVEKLPVL